jgi:hypothetical protein
MAGASGSFSAAPRTVSVILTVRFIGRFGIGTCIVHAL